MTAAIAAPVPAVRFAPFDRLPGTADDPFLRLAAGWLVGHPANTAKAYRRDLEGAGPGGARLGVHSLAAERYHVDAWVRHLTSEPQPRTGRPASAATVARKLSALAGFYDFGVLTYSRRLGASTEGLRRVPSGRPHRRRVASAARPGPLRWWRC